MRFVNRVRTAIVPYQAYFRLRFLAGLQYRLSALAGIATQFGFGFLYILLFRAFYRTDPASFPLTWMQTVTYLWLQQAFLLLVIHWSFDGELLSGIISGGVAYELTRPVDVYRFWFLRLIAGRLSGASLRGLPILIVALIMPPEFRLILPNDPIRWLAFLLSLLLTTAICTALSMFSYLLCLRVPSVSAARTLLVVLFDFLSGFAVPIAFFPEWAKVILRFLPFYYLQNISFGIFNQQITGLQIPLSLLCQGVWLLMLSLFGRWVMLRLLRRVVIQGG